MPRMEHKEPKVCIILAQNTSGHFRTLEKMWKPLSTPNAFIISLLLLHAGLVL